MKPETVYFRLCFAGFLLACIVGLKFAMSYLDIAHGNDWAVWRPGIGILLIFSSMVMSFIGYARRRR